jgi:hypothetical protein
MSGNSGSWTRQHPASEPPSRRGAAMAFDAIGKAVLLFGGMGESGLLHDTWIWDGSSWSEHHQNNGPAPRAFAGFAPDPNTLNLVLFGGTGGNGDVLSDTWLWDGSGWLQITTPLTPPGRSAASLAPDFAVGGILLFGGTFGDRVAQYLDDTWLWQGNRWSSLAPATRPPARSSAQMASHERSKHVLLFAGGNGRFLDDMWSWNGKNWVELHLAAAPPARQGGLAAYDAARGVVVIFGGVGPVDKPWGKPLNDIWSWNGSSWSRDESAATPPGGMRGAIAFNAARDELVLATDSGDKAFGEPETWTA